MLIAKTFRFEAAHHLPNVPDGHQCARVHGHSYEVEVAVKGDVDPELGWVMDFAELSSAWAMTGALMDHRDLNDIIDNPTAEILALYLGSTLEQLVDGLYSVTVKETANSRATWTNAQ